MPDDSPRGRFARTYHAAREARPPCTNDDRFAGWTAAHSARSSGGKGALAATASTKLAQRLDRRRAVWHARSARSRCSRGRCASASAQPCSTAEALCAATSRRGVQTAPFASNARYVCTAVTARWITPVPVVAMHAFAAVLSQFGASAGTGFCLTTRSRGRCTPQTVQRRVAKGDDALPNAGHLQRPGSPGKSAHATAAAAWRAIRTSPSTAA